MKAQAVTETKSPALSVVLDSMAFHHLRLRTQGPIDAIELIPDHEAVIASDVGCGDNRIEYQN